MPRSTRPSRSHPITLTPLSSAIKAREDELGVRLLERDSKQVTLTPAGAAYLAQARLVLERLAMAREAARAVAAGMRGAGLVPLRGMVPLTVGALGWRKEDAGLAALDAFIDVARALPVPQRPARLTR